MGSRLRFRGLARFEHDPNFLMKNDLSLDPILFSVWLPGVGWLRGKNERIFASDRREIAESAARLYGDDATVTEFDGEAMIDLEKIFLERESERKRASEALRSRGVLWRISTLFFRSVQR